jgi:hypothetical protein
MQLCSWIAVLHSDLLCIFEDFDVLEELLRARLAFSDIV